MKIDIRILPIFALMFLFLVDLGCLIQEIPPFEAYGSAFRFLVLHGVCGLGTGMAVGSIMKENHNG